MRATVGTVLSVSCVYPDRQLADTGLWTDVAFLAGFTSLSTTASIVQQVHTMVSWRDIKIQQYKDPAAFRDDAEIYITGASTGLDLLLFYMRM